MRRLHALNEGCAFILCLKVSHGQYVVHVYVQKSIFFNPDFAHLQTGLSLCCLQVRSTLDLHVATQILIRMS